VRLQAHAAKNARNLLAPLRLRDGLALHFVDQPDLRYPRCGRQGAPVELDPRGQGRAVAQRRDHVVHRDPAGVQRRVRLSSGHGAGARDELGDALGLCCCCCGCEAAPGYGEVAEHHLL